MSTEEPRREQNPEESSRKQYEKPHVTVEMSATPTQLETAILQEEYRERKREYDFWYWMLCFTFLTIMFVGVWWLFSIPSPRSQRVIVRLPDDSGIIDVTPAGNPYSAPRVVAVYNSPTRTDYPHRIRIRSRRRPVAIKRIRPAETLTTKSVETIETKPEVKSEGSIIAKPEIQYEGSIQSKTEGQPEEVVRAKPEEKFKPDETIGINPEVTNNTKLETKTVNI